MKFTKYHIETAYNEGIRDFSGLNLEDANFEDAYLHNANFANAYLRRANFADAYLPRANFEDAYLENANFTDAYLRRANFSDARLYNANFTDSELCNANFTDAYLRRANFTGAYLCNAVGNGKEIVTIGTSEYIISIIVPLKRIQIGCKNHSVEEWYNFSDEEIGGMDAGSLEWWCNHKNLIKLHLELIK